MTDHLVVAIVAVISGGFAIPVGFLLDLPAIETYLAAAAGALLGMFVFVFIGAGLRDWIVERLNISEEKLEGGREMLGKYGTKGRISIGQLPDPFTVPTTDGSGDRD